MAMSRRRLIAGVLATGVPLAWVRQVKAADDATAAAKEIVDAYLAATVARDAAALAAAFTEDGVLQSATGVSKGRAALQATFEAAFKASNFVTEITVIEARIAGDALYYRGDYAGSVATPDGPRQYKGRYGTVGVRVGGVWKAAQLTAVVLPPPAPPKS